MCISKTAEKYVLNTQYAFNNEGRLFLFHSTDHFQNDTKSDRCCGTERVWLARLMKSQVAEIVDIVSLKFTSDVAAG